MKELNIKKFVLGMMQTNCYLIEDGNNSMIIDPGDDYEIIVNYLVTNNLSISAILLTHGHFDHIGAVDDLVEIYHCPVYLHKNDVSTFYDDSLNLSNYYTPLKMKTKVIEVNEIININNYSIQFINLSGHTPGSCFIVFDDYNVVFSGDVLFKGSIGRYDFPNSSVDQTRSSINRIKNIDKDYFIYPGHGDSTSLFYEKNNNIYLSR